MYRVLPAKLFVVAIVWLALGIYLLAPIVKQVAHVDLKASAVPGLVWLVLNLILTNRVWRALWRYAPILERRIFPDLNGIWDVELQTNWPRQDQLVTAARASGGLDILQCDQTALAPLLSMKLQAEITQTWWKIEMTLTNPAQNTPIERSDTISVDPIAGDGHAPPTICYFYKQVNQTDNVSDDTEFYGAARLAYDFGTRQLKGHVWTARMWRRAINTAGSVTFTRRP